MEMEYSAFATAQKEEGDKEVMDSRKERRFRYFSPESNDDILQPSLFRSTRTDMPSSEDTQVVLSDCARSAYSDVEDITITSPYSKTFRGSL